MITIIRLYDISVKNRVKPKIRVGDRQVLVNIVSPMTYRMRENHIDRRERCIDAVIEYESKKRGSPPKR